MDRRARAADGQRQPEQARGEGFAPIRADQQPRLECIAAGQFRAPAAARALDPRRARAQRISAPASRAASSSARSSAGRGSASP